MGFVISITLPLLIGAGVARFCRPLPRQTRLGRLGWYYLLGIAANGFALFALGVGGVPFVLSLVLILIGAVFAAVRRYETSGLLPRHSRLATAVLILPFICALFVSAILPLTDYDGVVTWIPKAKAIASENSIAGPFFHGERGLNLHNRYPLLMPLNAAAVMRICGTTDNHVVRWLYVLIPLAGLLVARDYLWESSDQAAAWTCAGIAWLPQVIAQPEGGVLSAYNDLTVATFFGMALFAIGSGSSAGIWLAALILTKNEGAALAVAVIAAAAIFRKSRRADFVLPAIAIGIIAVWRFRVPDAYDERYSVLFRGLWQNIARTGNALTALFSAAVDVRIWSLFWPAVLIAAALSLATRERSKVAIPLTAVLAAIGAYLLAFVCTSWQINELANVTANRLWSQMLLAGAALLVSGWRAISALRVHTASKVSAE